MNKNLTSFHATMFYLTFECPSDAGSKKSLIISANGVERSLYWKENNDKERKERAVMFHIRSVSCAECEIAVECPARVIAFRNRISSARRS